MKTKCHRLTTSHFPRSARRHMWLTMESFDRNGKKKKKKKKNKRIRLSPADHGTLEEYVLEGRSTRATTERPEPVQGPPEKYWDRYKRNAAVQAVAPFDKTCICAACNAGNSPRYAPDVTHETPRGRTNTSRLVFQHYEWIFHPPQPSDLRPSYPQ